MALGPQFDGQLKLFMTPAEIMEHVNSSTDLKSGEDMPAMWSRKVEESKREYTGRHGSGVHDALSSGNDIIHGPTGNGKVPINYITRFDDTEVRRLDDMHHRVAAMAELDKHNDKQTYLNVNHIGYPYRGRRF